MKSLRPIPSSTEKNVTSVRKDQNGRFVYCHSNLRSGTATAKGSPSANAQTPEVNRSAPVPANTKEGFTTWSLIDIPRAPTAGVQSGADCDEELPPIKTSALRNANRIASTDLHATPIFYWEHKNISGCRPTSWEEKWDTAVQMIKEAGEGYKRKLSAVERECSNLREELQKRNEFVKQIVDCSKRRKTSNDDHRALAVRKEADEIEARSEHVRTGRVLGFATKMCGAEENCMFKGRANVPHDSNNRISGKRRKCKFPLHDLCGRGENGAVLGIDFS